MMPNDTFSSLEEYFSIVINWINSCDLLDQLLIRHEQARVFCLENYRPALCSQTFAAYEQELDDAVLQRKRHLMQNTF